MEKANEISYELLDTRLHSSWTQPRLAERTWGIAEVSPNGSYAPGSPALGGKVIRRCHENTPTPTWWLDKDSMKVRAWSSSKPEPVRWNIAKKTAFPRSQETLIKLALLLPACTNSVCSTPPPWSVKLGRALIQLPSIRSSFNHDLVEVDRTQGTMAGRKSSSIQWKNFNSLNSMAMAVLFPSSPYSFLRLSSYCSMPVLIPHFLISLSKILIT